MLDLAGMRGLDIDLDAGHGKAGEPRSPLVKGAVVIDDERRHGQALRHAREIVDAMRWRGVAVPPVYARMTEEFQTLVRSGAYTDWVASAQKAAR